MIIIFINVIFLNVIKFLCCCVFSIILCFLKLEFLVSKDEFLIGSEFL